MISVGTWQLGPFHVDACHQNASLAPSVDVQTDLDNILLVRTLGLTLLDTQFYSQDWIGFGTTTTHERLDAAISDQRRDHAPPWTEYHYSRYERGSFYSGTRAQTIAGLTLRARPGYIVYMNGEWNGVRLPEGRFSSNLYRVVGESQFTPFVALVNNVQFDTVSRVMGGSHVSGGFSDRATTSMSSIRTTGATTRSWTDLPTWTEELPLSCCIHRGSSRCLGDLRGVH